MKTIKITCEGTDYVDFKILVPFQGHLKTLSEENLEKLKKSIIKYGFTVPGFIWQSGKRKFILDSHQRQLALYSLEDDGYTIPDIPIVYIQAKNKTEAKEKLLHITSQYGKFEKDGLSAFLESIDGDAELMETLRLTDDEIDLSIFSEPDPDTETTGDDDIPEKVKTITKLGDLWELGDHRLLCGDSTEAETVAKLMDGKKADMVFTDPPYGMNLDTDYSKMPSTKKEGNKKYSTINGDGKDFTPDLINTIFDNFGYCKEIFLFGADYYSEYLKDKNKGSWVVWDKRVEEKFDRMIGSGFELCWSKAKHKRMLARINNTLFSGDPEARNKLHPTQKPTKLVNWFFEYYSLSNKIIIVDLYIGSGTTILSCEINNKKCYGIEIDPHYCDVTVQRYRNWCEDNDREPIIKRNGKKQ